VEQRFELVDAILLARMAEARTPSSRHRVGLGDPRANTRPGPDRLDLRSARDAAVDTSRRRSASRSGSRRKTLARIFRFEHAVALLRRGDSTLGEIAVECGYFDQAHLNRDFREFADAPPAAFVRRIVPDGGLVL
jgi:AraC-like DNA-binding protein